MEDHYLPTSIQDTYENQSDIMVFENVGIIGVPPFPI